MLATGEASDKAIAAVSKRFNISKQNAGRVVMTESAYFSSAAQRDCLTSRVPQNAAINDGMAQKCTRSF